MRFQTFKPDKPNYWLLPDLHQVHINKRCPDSTIAPINMGYWNIFYMRNNEWHLYHQLSRETEAREFMRELVDNWVDDHGWDDLMLVPQWWQLIQCSTACTHA